MMKHYQNFGARDYDIYCCYLWCRDKDYDMERSKEPIREHGHGYHSCWNDKYRHSDDEKRITILIISPEMIDGILNRYIDKQNNNKGWSTHP